MGPIAKDTFREIKKTIPRYLSIMAIICLGVAFFIGIKATGPAMVESARQYFKDYLLVDGQISSTVGLNESDLKAVESIPGIRLEPVKSIQGTLEPGTQTIKLYGVKEGDQAFFQILEGRFPQNSGEIALDQKYLDQINEDLSQPIQLGSQVTLTPKEMGFSDQINSERDDSVFSLEEVTTKSKTFKVVGFVQTPYYYQRVARGIDHAVFGLIQETDILTNVYLDIFYWIDQPAGEAYSPAYQKQSQDIKRLIEKKLEHRPQERLVASQLDIREEIDQLQLDLDQAQAELDQAQANLVKGKQDLKRSQKDLAAGQEQLLLGEAELMSQILAGLLPSASVRQQAMAQLQEGQVSSVFGQGQSFIFQQQVNQGQWQADKQVVEAGNQLRQAQLAKIQLDKVKEELNIATYTVRSRQDMDAYQTLKDNAEKLDVISNLFPVFFFAIAVLVVFVTVKRMASEQRVFLGTMQQMGYPNWKILNKFIAYASTAGLIGIGFGIYLGYKIFPPIIMQAYNSMFTIDNPTIPMNMALNLFAAGVAFLCSLIPAIITPLELLRQAPANLLKPEPPKQGKQIFIEKWPWLWRIIPFNQKMTLRNLFRYKGRNLMTLFGVAGCAMLILTGFGIKDTISGLIETQFDQLHKYDATVYIEEAESDYQVQSLIQELKKYSGVQSIYPVCLETMTMKNEELSEDLIAMVPLSDTMKFLDFVQLRYRDQQESDRLDLNQTGPLYTERLGELFDIRPGQIYDLTQDGQSYQIPFTKPVENYVMHYLFMNMSSYQQIFGSAAKANALLMIYDKDVKANQLEDQLLKEEGVQAVVNIASVEGIASKTMGSLNVITIVLIVAAAGLAFVVLYNLTNINIEERIRELATIEVLGFYVFEISLYVYEEIFIITIWGSLIGLGLGRLLTHVIMKQMQMNNMLFYPRTSLLSYLLSFALTFIFSTLVMLLMHRKIRRINMVEALKGID